MIRSCNSDTSKFVCLTNLNIKEYFETIPLNVEEITIWNYQMCLYPSFIELKEPLDIPSFTRFTNLKCVRFYNENICSMEGTLPPSVQRVFFISSILKNKWMNVCLYGLNINNIKKYGSSDESPKSILSLLYSPSSMKIKKAESMDDLRKTTKPSVRRPRSRSNPIGIGVVSGRRTRRSRSLWRIIISIFNAPWFRTSHSKIIPHNEVELVEMVPIDTPNEVEALLVKGPLPYTHTIESINRFKKTYDLLVNEQIITYLIE